MSRKRKPTGTGAGQSALTAPLAFRYDQLEEEQLAYEKRAAQRGRGNGKGPFYGSVTEPTSANAMFGSEGIDHGEPPMSMPSGHKRVGYYTSEAYRGTRPYPNSYNMPPIQYGDEHGREYAIADTLADMDAQPNITALFCRTKHGQELPTLGERFTLMNPEKDRVRDHIARVEVVDLIAHNRDKVCKVWVNATLRPPAPEEDE